MKFFLGVFLLLLMLGKQAEAAVAQAEVSSQGGSSVTGLSYSHTCTCASNGMILVFASLTFNSGTWPIASANYNSLPLTLITSAEQNYVWQGAFYRVAPSTGANTLSIQTTDVTEIVIGAISYTGVNQATPVGTATTDSGTGETRTVSVTVPSGGLGAIATNAWGMGVGFMVPSSGTIAWDLNSSGVADLQSIGVTVTTSTTLTVDWSPHGSTYSAMVGVPINQAAGGGPTTAVRHRPVMQ